MANSPGADLTVDRLLDSSVLIELERGTASTQVSELVESGGAAISVITASELLHGAHRASADRRVRRRLIVERILGSITPLPIDTNVARAHAELWAELESNGNSINSHDLWIAATALVYDLEVLTLDLRDFGRVPGLRVHAAQLHALV